MSEFDPAQVESLLDTRSRLQRLLSYAESGMKSSAVSLIKEQLLNSKSGDAGFFVGVMNSTGDTALRANLQDCLWALLSMKGRPAPQLFGERGLYPNLPAHEQWDKSIAVLRGTVASLATLQSGAVTQQHGQEAMDPCLMAVPPNADADQPVRVDARKLLRDAEEVLRFLQRLPSETTAELKHWPTSFLFRSFFHFVERLAIHLRPISENCPAVERGPVILDGILDGDRAELLAWSQSLENLLREICLERFGARFYFATHADTGERLIHFTNRELTAFSPSRDGLPNPEVASLAKLQTADIHALNQFISKLAELVDRGRSAEMESGAVSGVFAGTELPPEWCEVVLWLKDRYCANDPASNQIFRESEAAATFPTLLNLDALWSLLETHGTIGQKRFGHFSIELPDTDTAMNQWILPTADDIREIKPSIWSFAKGVVRSMRKIVAATKENAAWNVSRMLADVLAWATYPDPRRLSLGWWDKNKANAESVLKSAVRSFDGDENALQRLRDARSLTVRFLGLMYHNPTLSKVPVQDWPVKAYQRLFDDLSELEREFRILGNSQPGPQRPEAADNTSNSFAASDSITPVSSTVPPVANGAGLAPEFTGPWKHLYAFLWRQSFDLSHSRDDYRAVFETYRSEFGKKSSGSGKQKRRRYKMPSSSGAKGIRQGYCRQLKRQNVRK